MRSSKFLKYAVIAAVTPLLLFLAACGDDSDAGDTTVRIAISPSSATVETGNSVELTVEAKNTAITWPNPGAVEGSFTINRNRATYTPP